MNGNGMRATRWGFGLAIVFYLASCGSGGSGSSGSSGSSGNGDSQFTVTATARSGGAISPANSAVERGATATFTVTAESGWEIENVDGCGGSLSGTTYTTAPITGPCTVSATFGSLLPETPALTLTPQAIKTFRFHWPASNRATEYRLLENPDGISGFTPVVSLPGGARSHELSVFLPDRVNARYILQACNQFGCKDSPTVFVTGSLVEAVGYFKGANPLLDGVSSFGGSVALSADGNTMAVGSPHDRTVGQDLRKGAVYVFARRNGVWVQEARLVSGNQPTQVRLGFSVALSSDGNVLAAGDPQFGGSGGYVHVFTRDPCPTCPNGGWRLRPNGTLSGNDVAPTYAHRTTFGSAIALSANGETIAVSAPWFPPAPDSFAEAGAVWVLTHSGDYDWQVLDEVRSLQPTTPTLFGQSVALSADGITLAVGAPLERMWLPGPLRTSTRARSMCSSA